MTATSLNRHIWRAIGEFAGPPKELTRAACASKDWKAQVYTHIFGAFLTRYAQEPIFAERMALFAHLPNETQRIGALFKEAIQNGRDCWIHPTRTLYPPSLLAYYQKLRAISLVNFLKQLAEAIPEAKAFLDTLDEKDPQITEKIKAWLHANKPLLEKCKSLNCDYFNYAVYVMPDEIELFSGLTELTFEQVKLIALSSKIASLKNLERLVTTRSFCTHLLPAITCLPKLKYLSVREGRLNSLPENLNELRSLTRLDISQHSAISSIPQGLCQLSTLRELSLSGLAITTLPPEIGNLSQLQYLDIYFNNLSSLPSSIGNLKHLINLNISWNALTTLPNTLVSLTKLVHLELDHNPIQAVPKALKTCEVSVIRNHYKIIGAAIEPEVAPLITTSPQPELTPPPPAPSPSLWEQAQELVYTCFSCIKEAIAALLRLLFGRA